MKGRRVPINNDLKNKLTVSPFIPGSPIKTFNKMYKLTNKFMYIPRYYNNDGDLIVNEISRCKFSVASQPREYQKNVINDIFESLKLDGACIACLYTGWGKTFASLYIAHLLGVKTIVIVNKESLLKQWEEQIKIFLNIEPGIIQGKQINTTPDICIGMIQSLSQKEYPLETFNSFSFAIFDETHHYCSKVFSEVFYKLGTYYNLGLTATLNRSDKLEYTLNWFLNKPTVNIQLLIIEPSIRLYNYYDYSTNIIKYLPNGKVATPSSVTNITEIVERNKLIINLIKEMYACDRNILVLTERKNHCDYIYNTLKNNYSIGIYYGGMKTQDLKKSNECRVIVATYQMASEGYDNPKLDTLILASPKCNIEQAVGRILRKKNNNPALVLDICDNISVFNNWNKKRNAFYRSKKFKIELTNEEIHDNSIEDTLFTKECLIID